MLTTQLAIQSVCLDLFPLGDVFPIYVYVSGYYENENEFWWTGQLPRTSERLICVTPLCKLSYSWDLIFYKAPVRDGHNLMLVNGQMILMQSSNFVTAILGSAV